MSDFAPLYFDISDLNIFRRARRNFESWSDDEDVSWEDIPLPNFPKPARGRLTHDSYNVHQVQYTANLPWNTRIGPATFQSQVRQSLPPGYFGIKWNSVYWKRIFINVIQEYLKLFTRAQVIFESTAISILLCESIWETRGRERYTIIDLSAFKMKDFSFL